MSQGEKLTLDRDLRPVSGGVASDNPDYVIKFRIDPETKELLTKSTITDKLPTSGNNPSTALSYDVDGNLQYIDETIGSTTYRTTLTYSAGVLVGVSEAVEL